MKVSRFSEILESDHLVEKLGVNGLVDRAHAATVDSAGETIPIANQLADVMLAYALGFDTPAIIVMAEPDARQRPDLSQDFAC